MVFQERAAFFDSRRSTGGSRREALCDSGRDINQIRRLGKVAWRDDS
jgi:hypothetical protein